jgi:hypothetical protein
MLIYKMGFIERLRFNSFVNSALSAKVGDALYDDPQYDTGRDTFRSIAINAFGAAAGNSFANQFEYIRKRSINPIL